MWQLNQALAPFADNKKSCIWTYGRTWRCVADMIDQSNDHIRTLFTEIGCIMEDASVVALVWVKSDPRTIEGRYQQLLDAHRKADAALEKIKAAVGAI